MYRCRLAGRVVSLPLQDHICAVEEEARQGGAYGRSTDRVGNADAQVREFMDVYVVCVCVIKGCQVLSFVPVSAVSTCPI